MTDPEHIVAFLLEQRGLLDDTPAPDRLDDQTRRAIAEAIGNEPRSAELARRCSRLLDALEAAPELEREFHVADGLRGTLLGLAPGRDATAAATVAGIVDAAVRSLRVVLDSWAPTAAPVVGIRGGDGSRRIVVADERARIDVRIEPSTTRIGVYQCLGRVEGDAVHSLRWEEVDADQTHELRLDPHGFFELTIGPGRHALHATDPDGRVCRSQFDHPPAPRRDEPTTSEGDRS